jgi:aminobenzoyl-glutamate utilization protein B
LKRNVMSESVKQASWSWIDENANRLIDISDEIWGYAELGFIEFKSSKLLADELEHHGFSVERGVADIPTAFVGTYGKGQPVIGVMGEFDALFGLSQKAVPYKESIEEGAPGHGCGHNIHGTSGLGGALAVRHAMEREGIQGTIKFFGCPAEEMLSGKIWMVRGGVFDGVDACISHHPGAMNTADLMSCNACKTVKFEFHGKAAHAAGSPEQGRSALDAVELMNVGVNFLREHIIEKARIHYVIEDGGGQPNVVPDYALSSYYVRAPEMDQLEPIYDRVVKIAEGATLMTGTTMDIEFVKCSYNLVPNKTISEAIVANMKKIGAPEYTEEELEFAQKIGGTIPRQAKVNLLRRYRIPDWESYLEADIFREILDPMFEGESSAGSTDVGDVSWKAPTVEFNTATWVLGTPAHSWQAVAQGASGLGHKSLLFAAKTIAGTVLDLMTDPEMLKRAQDEHRSRLGGRKYKSAVPPGSKPLLNHWKR